MGHRGAIFIGKPGEHRTRANRANNAQIVTITAMYACVHGCGSHSQTGVGPLTRTPRIRITHPHYTYIYHIYIYYILYYYYITLGLANTDIRVWAGWGNPVAEMAGASIHPSIHWNSIRVKPVGVWGRDALSYHPAVLEERAWLEQQANRLEMDSFERIRGTNRERGTSRQTMLAGSKSMGIVWKWSS
jgi:hypothetical protein